MQITNIFPKTIQSLPVLYRGQTGKTVKNLQERLNILGENLFVNGIFGPKTEAAVKNFQKDNGLQIDGIVSPQTWNSLLKATAVPFDVLQTLPVLRLGSTGDNVFRLQNRLNDFGENVLIDGIFGSKTEVAVKNFQRRFRLTVDGIVGPLTWNALLHEFF